MSICCPHCGRDLDPKEIVARESWYDENGEVVRAVVLQCPGCQRALTPQARDVLEPGSLTS